MLTPRTFSRNGWSHWHVLGAAGMLGLGVWATWEAWQALIVTAYWHGETEALILAPLVAAWLFWVRRERLRLCEPVGAWKGALLVGGSWLLGQVGAAIDAEVFVHLAALGVVVGCVLAVLGTDVLWHFLPAFGALLLLIPAPWMLHERFAQPLTSIVADLSVLLYRLVGVTASRQGPWLEVDDLAVPVLAACGAPGLKATFLVAYGLAFGQPLRVWVRGLILAAAPIAAILCQVLGTLIIVWLASLEQMDLQRSDLLAGWMVLPVAFAALLGLIKLLGWASVPVQYYTLARDR